MKMIRKVQRRTEEAVPEIAQVEGRKRNNEDTKLSAQKKNFYKRKSVKEEENTECRRWMV